jgi:ABC-type nitrate/sulfonate/bicarbonate transport system substrate-binding protein
MKPRRWRVFSLFAAFSLLVAACGTNDDTAAPVTEPDDTEETDVAEDEEETDDTGETDDTEAAEEPEDFGDEPIRVMISTRFNLPMIGSDAAEELGIFDEMGLPVENLEGQDVPQGLASGDIDVGLASPNRFIGAILEGLDATIVGPTVDVWDQYIIVRSDLGIEDVDELEPGMSIGISSFGSAGHYSGEALAEQLGWDEGDYEVVTLGDLDGLLAGLRQGTIDMFMWSAQAAFTLQEEGHANLLGNVGEFIGPNPLDVIIVSNRTIEERPEAVRAFCEGFYEGQRRFKEDRDLATDTFVNEWGYEPDITPAIIESGAEYLSTDDTITDEMLENMAEATVFTIDGVDELSGSDVDDMYTPCSEL